MKLLILGGTRFLGRHLVEAALARSHQVTLFNRGRTNPRLFPGVQRLIGDRNVSVDALKGGRWDAAIDTSGYVTAQVQASARALAASIGHYAFISSLSVYRDFSRPGVDESAPLAKLPDLAVEKPGDNATYGARKAVCEQVLERILPGRVLNVRPGILVGPHDETGRFTYWVRRIAAGGEILAPGDPARPVQLIDVRDLAAWTIQMIEQRAAGPYNVTGPAFPMAFQQMLNACRSAAPGDISFAWINDAFLLEKKLSPSNDFPFWIPAGTVEFAGFFAVNCRKALNAGLTFRPLVDTARDTLQWDLKRDPVAEPTKQAGLDAKREQELIGLWRRLSQAANI